MLCPVLLVISCAVVCDVTAYHHHHAPASECEDVSSPRTVTSAGVIKGSWMETRKGRRFQAYRGIRYAEPPVGDLRFEPPVPVTQYEGEVDASAEGPACPTPAPEEYYVNFSEDCLRLNVYTPTNARNASLPVVVFIHPGGFYSMSGRSDLAGPHYLLDRDLVLVTINYRLASFGFLSTGDALAPGNNGFRDQAVALRWVQQHVARFGGDPAAVTLAGCSAGSYSVLLHMISPMTRGLFQRGIALSGSPVGKERLPRHQRHLAKRQAQLLGCPRHNSSVILSCLRTKSWREIGDSLRGFFDFNYDPVGIWLPLVELDFGQPRFLAVDPLDAIRDGSIDFKPLIVSVTEDEFYWLAFSVTTNASSLAYLDANWERQAPISFMLPLDETAPGAARRLRQGYLGEATLAADDHTTRGLGRLYGDAIIGFPVNRLVSVLAQHSTQPVYYSQFSYVGQHSHYEDPVTNKPIGAMHHDDLIYLFSLSYRFPLITQASPDAAMVDTMTALWYTFAKYGEVASHGELPASWPRWPPVSGGELRYLRIERAAPGQHDVRRDMFPERYRLWADLYPLQRY